MGQVAHWPGRANLNRLSRWAGLGSEAYGPGRATNEIIPKIEEYNKSLQEK